MTEEVQPEVAAEVVDDSLPKRRAKKAEEAPVLTKYVVANGAISPNGGGRADLIHPGSVVELTADQAKHYNKLGYLKPYIGD